MKLRQPKNQKKRFGRIICREVISTNNAAFQKTAIETIDRQLARVRHQLEMAR